MENDDWNQKRTDKNSSSSRRINYTLVQPTHICCATFSNRQYTLYDVWKNDNEKKKQLGKYSWLVNSREKHTGHQQQQQQHTTGPTHDLLWIFLARNTFAHLNSIEKSEYQPRSSCGYSLNDLQIAQWFTACEQKNIAQNSSVFAVTFFAFLPILAVKIFF